MVREFALPDLGEGIAEAQIIRLMIEPGDKVEEDQSLMEVETDKAAVEIPSPFAGIAKNVHVSEGQTVNVGDVIVTFDDGRADTKDKGEKNRAEEADEKETKDGAQKKQKKQEKAQAEEEERDRKRPSEKKDERGREPEEEEKVPARRTSAPAAPAVRKLAREMGVDLDEVDGSGPGGRVSKEDVERHAGGKGKPKEAAGRRRPEPEAPLPGIKDADKWGPVRKEKLSQIRKTIATQMARSAFTAAHVTHGDEADITQLERWRKQLNEATNNDPKLTIMTFVIAALCRVLRKHPIFNSSFDEDNSEIIYKDYINMGIAVDTERGLIVPVIRNADQLSLREIAAELRSIADRIRGKQFDIEDLRGGTFTITNVGALGGTFSTPIINYPEVAILGLGRSRETPVFSGDQIVKALMMPVFVSFDHRVTDGANAARFTHDLVDLLETPAQFLLD